MSMLLGQQLCLLHLLLVFCFVGIARADEPEVLGLTIAWKISYLTISGAGPGREIHVHYREAYCRAGSTDRD